MNGGGVGDDETGRPVETLVDLVRQTFTQELSPHEQLGLVRLEQTWQRQRAPRLGWRLPGVGVLAAALAVAAILPAGLLVYRRYARLTYQVVNGTVGPEGRIQQTSPGTVIVFSEGSQIDVAGSAHARIASLTTEGGEVVLEDGGVRADIVHRPRARWTVEAGPYTIRVTGTAFDVRWSPSGDRLDCRMKRGSVVITGPLVPAGVTLTAGMRLTASPRAGQLAIGDDGTTVAVADGAPRTAPVAESPLAPRQELSQDPAPAADGSPLLDDSGPRRHSARSAPVAAHPEGLRRSGRLDDHRRDPERNWSRQLAQGDFQGVLAEAESQGLDRVLDSAPGGDLAALADAARYTHHAATARRALLTLRARFPRAAASRDTAFFLGGLAESEPAAGDRSSALDWYDQYLREYPNGRFVNEAWGRKMVLTHELHGRAAARPIATEYLRRSSGGPYATAARKLLQAP